MEKSENKNFGTGGKKMKRNNFFKNAGTAILGLVAFSNLPLKFFQSGTPSTTSIKIAENPNAVKRKSREVTHG